nr:hypothetical protein [Clostridium sp. J1101437_171009_A5]
MECSVRDSVNLHDLDEYNTHSRPICVTATADFAQDPLYDLQGQGDQNDGQR